jgi:chaperone required for assembly of F1-ATPase
VKRFWDNAQVATDGDGWRVLLDGRPLRLPDGGPLLVRQPALAAALAAEWQAAGARKGGEMSYDDVPLTRLAGTAQERIAPDPEPVVLEISRYAETDLLCYRAERPDALVRRQAEQWQPWLDWAEAAFGARLRVTAGVMPVPQEPAALAALAQAVAAHDALALAALGIAVPVLGSLVLGLALAAGQLDAMDAHALAMLDEIFQEESWGHDDAAAARRARIGRELAVAERLLALCRAGGTVG